jgi:hypothetical protein
MNDGMKKDQFTLFKSQCRQIGGKIATETDQEIRCVVDDHIDVTLSIPKVKLGSDSWATLLIKADKSPPNPPLKLRFDQDLFSF